MTGNDAKTEEHQRQQKETFLLCPEALSRLRLKLGSLLLNSTPSPPPKKRERVREREREREFYAKQSKRQLRYLQPSETWVSIVCVCQQWNVLQLRLCNQYLLRSVAPIYSESKMEVGQMFVRR